MNREKLEAEFHKDMLSIYHKACEHGYRPTRFLHMVNENGGLETAKQLLATPNEQPGLTELWERDLLDISMERLVLKEEYNSLFSEDERQIAKDRLKAYGYEFND